MIHLLAYTPFLQPLKIWDYWPWLIFPLCFGVSIVYKCVRVDNMARVPVEAAKTTAWIVGGMIVAALVLFFVVDFVSR